MAQLGQTQYLKRNINGTDVYQTLSYGGNIPWGYEKLSKDQYLQGLQGKVNTAQNFMKNYVKQSWGGYAPVGGGGWYVGETYDQSSIDKYQSQINEVQGGQGINAPNYIDPSFSKFQSNAPTTSEQYYTEEFRRTLPMREQQRLNQLYGQSNPIVQSTPVGMKEVALGGGFGFAPMVAPKPAPAPRPVVKAVATAPTAPAKVVSGGSNPRGLTTAQVKAIQTQAGIKVDGIIGPQTQKVLSSPTSAVKAVAPIVNVPTSVSKPLTIGSSSFGPIQASVPIEQMTNEQRAQLGYSNIPGDYNTATGQLEKQVDSIMESIVNSGKTLNPAILPEDLAGITPEEFLRQAGLAINPSYLEKFNTVKDEMTRGLSNIGYDLNLKKQDIQRTAERTLEQGTEELAGRGLAFSGQRERFGTDVSSAQTRDTEAARTLAFRSAQDIGTKAEGLVGTETLRGYNPQTIEGQSPFQYGSTPRTGSLTFGQRTDTAAYQQGLETRARDILTQYPGTNKASIQRALSFA